jgi:DNA-directed RNA polymerase subunit K/omega
MNSTILSRAAKIIPDADLLVNVVRLRVRQLVAGHRPLIAVPPGMGLADVALSEIADNKLRSEPKRLGVGERCTSRSHHLVSGGQVDGEETSGLARASIRARARSSIKCPLTRHAPAEKINARAYLRAHTASS